MAPGLLSPPPREVSRLEHLDWPDRYPRELEGNLADIARLNRLGPTRELVGCIVPFLARTEGGRPLTVLDVGTGGGDLALAIADAASIRGRPARVIGLDNHPAILAHASRAVRHAPGVRLVAGDALALPFRPRSIDLAVCSLVFHHLPEEGVVALLSALAASVRLGFVVSDLRRGRAAWVAAWLLTRALSRNPLTRHDGPLSVRRAYTAAELAALSTRAGVSGVCWRRARRFRVMGLWTRPVERADDR